MELSLFSFVSLFVCLFGQQRKNNNKVSASYTRTNKHEKTNASHQHSAFKPRWAPIVLRLVIT